MQDVQVKKNHCNAESFFKISNNFHFVPWTEMLGIRTFIPNIIVRIAKSEDSDQTAPSIWPLSLLFA